MFSISTLMLVRSLANFSTEFGEENLILFISRYATLFPFFSSILLKTFISSSFPRDLPKKHILSVLSEEGEGDEGDDMDVEKIVRKMWEWRNVEKCGEKCGNAEEKCEGMWRKVKKRIRNQFLLG
jgi:hypothetical protein